MMHFRAPHVVCIVNDDTIELEIAPPGDPQTGVSVICDFAFLFSLSRLVREQEERNTVCHFELQDDEWELFKEVPFGGSSDE